VKLKRIDVSENVFWAPVIAAGQANVVITAVGVAGIGVGVAGVVVGVVVGVVEANVAVGLARACGEVVAFAAHPASNTRQAITMPICSKRPHFSIYRLPRHLIGVFLDGWLMPL
jgi:hypothetical protein